MIIVLTFGAYLIIGMGMQRYDNVDIAHIITLYPRDPKETLHILLVSNDTRFC